ncbi:hypothetical protein [Streptomyces sp.]|uniref:hypothetical protein n=1 Tax=Streptomyces sp. TaxID=1931 RepID=UPI002D56B5C3|nr:hypothetical protein [Streptomyces sp.]HZF91960.1 hypothetical protein [Streptomyces sp.]
MHGHGYVQPVKQPPPTAWLVFLRVLFVVISILSLGFLAWTMLLRLALVTRKSLDWGLFVAVLAIDALAMVLLGNEPGEEIHTAAGWTGLGLLLGTLVVVIAYYLSADVRHFHQLRYGAYGPQPAPAYGYPQPVAPYAAGAAATVPPTPTPPPTPPAARMPQTPPAPVAPPPQRPAPARIDQVRAELDELSELLRRQDGRRDGDHEGGR